MKALKKKTSWREILCWVFLGGHNYDYMGGSGDLSRCTTCGKVVETPPYWVRVKGMRETLDYCKECAEATFGRKVE